ncbi:MAG: hypothetical protein MI862_23530 [Desulfobacterales bacterium]|nr:hypothetical protein [Desulfobacterales bacterium]
MKQILWLIQSNQITPSIYNFLKIFRTRMEQEVEISFIVPDTSAEILEKIKELDATLFKVSSRTAAKSRQGYLAKKEILQKKAFSSGLTYTDTLLLDDLGGGAVSQTFLNIEKSKKTACLILQIPTPLGSSDIEERVFHAAVMWAGQNRIPVIGYELLPLDTRWTLAPSLPDGVITRYEESYDHLKTELDHTNLWQMPFYEASIFSSLADQFNIDGLKASYHYRTTLKIPESRTVFYLPHNVAMIYEYQELLKLMSPCGKHIHLMFSTGKDQIRGAHTQKEMIQMIYKNELDLFSSHSFHEMNAPWEMLMADSLVSCSACYQTLLAQEKNIPTLIYEPMLPDAAHGFKRRINEKDKLLEEIAKRIESKAKKTELGTLLLHVTRSIPGHG